MALPGYILGQENVTGAEAPFRSVADLNLPLARKSDNELTFWRLVPVVDVVGRGTAELDILCALEGCGHCGVAPWGKLKLEILEMGLAVSPGEYPDVFHLR